MSFLFKLSKNLKNICKSYVNAFVFIINVNIVFFSITHDRLSKSGYWELNSYYISLASYWFQILWSFDSIILAGGER